MMMLMVMIGSEFGGGNLVYRADVLSSDRSSFIGGSSVLLGGTST